ncbi:MAG TPA: tetratricopeptide repeat protein [Opitutaceae bacterium]|nr:tetratricopeptide repeat protein [Opitutaceae bacterium]
MKRVLVAVASLVNWNSAMSEENSANATGCVLPSHGPEAFFVRRGVLLASCMVVFAALAVYLNSFTGPFIYDDVWSIETNPSIHHLGSALSPPLDEGVGGRPMLNLTYALNYALGGMNVWGYHAVNLLVHILAGLALFGIVRRTLLRPVLSGRFGAEAVPLAMVVAVIWAVHPLQTEAVTYISQRAESLMGLFYLLTLYCFIRGAENKKSRGESPESRDTPTLSSGLWFAGSVIACLLGAMSKEVIVTAPLMVWLYDRTFVAGSFREAWRLRWRYYLGLAGTWLLLACLMTGISQRGVGFDQGVTGWSYALTSCRSVVLYFKLALWPHPLVFIHDTNVIRQAAEALPYALVLAGLLAGTAMALWRRPVMGFAGAWALVILGPTSSIIPLAAQPMAEHRMYLSLAAVIAWEVLGLYAWIGRRSWAVFAAAALGLGWLSIQRNQDYESRLAIWSDTVEKNPDNASARYSLGNAMAQIPDLRSAAVSEYAAALQIKPDYREARINMADTLAKIPGRLPEAIAQYEEVLRTNPNDLQAHNNLGSIFLGIPGRTADAIAQYEAVLRIDPDYAEAHFNLCIAFLQASGRWPEAMAHLKTALRLKPDLEPAQQLLDAIQKAHSSDKNHLKN